MSGQESKNRNIRGLIIAAVIGIGALATGYLTNNQQFVLDLLLGLGLIFLAITILVSIHELGHFLTARMFGMRVETFSIGFPPKIFSVKRGETSYQIGATPIGGYVKISGMIDESFDTEHVGQAPEPYEFRSKPVWQRLIVMSGGVIMNILLGILIFSTAKYITGDRFLPIEAINEHGIEVFENTIGDSLGFETGDKLLTVNGDTFPYFRDYYDISNIQSEGYYEVIRDGKKATIPISRTAINFFADDSIGKVLFAPDHPVLISKVNSGGAQAAGIQALDQIIRVDSFPIQRFSELKKALANFPKDTAQVAYIRDGKEQQAFVSLVTDSVTGRKLMGIEVKWEPYFEDKYIVEKYNFVQALAPGSKAAFGIMSKQAQGLARLPESGIKTGKLIQGPIEITKFYVELFKAGGWPDFLLFTGTLSMILALMNILPIPALDGGHIVFLLLEWVTGREPSTQVKIVAQYIGLIIVFSLMAYLLLNGLLKQF